ncbi:enoyl-CoA hydratase/isomerase family protein [Cumulibacter soli]|uniref:enoyl-CoA hydratase/isomerase family protein n=1 Tax=Cumulibacter soli TaxID=2546344 RepID=UPI001067D5D4|nr:enoyl-CoA hydratase-related protein [Cumulibacter soli]
MGDLVEYQSEHRVATIRLNRPEKMNALTDDLVRELHAVWIRFEESDDRAAVLAAAGDRAFCVGADLTNPPDDMSRAVPNVGVALSKPVVAAITGHCVGGGYILVQHSDLAVASSSAVFSYPEARVGITGGLCAGTYARVPAKIAAEFLLLGEPLSAQRAYEVGMVNRVVPDGQQEEVALQMARTLAASAPLVVATIKGFGEQVVAQSPAEQAAITRARLFATNQSADALEGRESFAQKRKPNFTGK